LAWICRNNPKKENAFVKIRTTMLTPLLRWPGSGRGTVWFPLFPIWLLAGACLLVLILPIRLRAQDALAFEQEIRSLQQKYDSLWNPGRPALVFTGSSSIRMWEALQDSFPHHQILNMGFGGSQASDLLYYLDALVLKYRPEKVFIYEGDNDLAEGKRPRRVLKDLQEIATRILKNNPQTPIVFISAKPSPSRWRFRGKFRRFNRKLERWAGKANTLIYADVWSPMLRGRKVDASLFIEDGLHLNDAGYEIWFQVLRPLVETPLKIKNP
jgi:lysophospholipase L1-like esterase